MMTPSDRLAAITAMTDRLEALLWRTGGGHGPWESCLAALILAFDPQCRTRRLIEALPATAGMDEVGLLNTMANLGYFSSAEEVALRDIEPRLLPCLFVTGDDPWVVLSAQEGVMTVYDGARGRMAEIRQDAPDAGRQGRARFFTPFDRHRAGTSKFMREGTGHSWFGAVARRFSGTLWLVLGVCLVLNLVAMVPALFVMVVYDRVISPADLSSLPYLATGVVLALLAEHWLRSVRAEALSWMTARLDNVVGGRIFSHLIGLRPELIEQASVAAQVARIRTFESVRDFFSSAVFLSFLEIPFVLVALALMAAIAGWLAIVPVAAIAGYVCIFAVVRARVKRAIRLAAKASSARQQFSIETFEKLPSVRMNGLTGIWARKFDDITGREVLMNFELGFLGTVAETLAHALTVMAAVMIVGFGAHLVWAQAITTGALVACMILVWRIVLPFYSLCTMIPRLEQLRNSVLQVNSLMELESEAEHAMTAVLPVVRGHVVAENAAFAYDDGKTRVIEGLSLDAKPGTLTVLTGGNGAGKTTVLKLIKGLYHPQQGAVRLDGFDIRQLDARQLRQQIAYLPQQADFFPGTVAENLLFGNLLATEAEVEAALRRADAWEEVSRLENGIRTEIGRAAFPANLAAKLSLARLYLMDAPVVLIDELPNAVLNGCAGEGLRAYLRDVRGRKTVIIACHRRDLMADADTVVTLARGRAKPDKMKENA